MFQTIFLRRVTNIDKIKDLATSVTEGRDVYVLDVEVRGNVPNVTVWVYVDAESGTLNIDECGKISKELGLLIDANELIDAAYRLNVSSPGLDRPLSDPRQYKTNIGRKARIKYRDENGAVKSLEGFLESFDGENIVVKEDKSQITLALVNVTETKIIPVF